MANYGTGAGSIYTDIMGQQHGEGAPNPQQTLYGFLDATIAPQVAQAQTQYNLGQWQLGQVGPQLQQQQAYNATMAGYQGQNLALKEAGTALQGQALNQQQAQQQAQQAYEQQQYALQSGQYPEQQAEAALQYQNALKDTQSAQAIGGTTLTEGGKRQISTLGQQYGFQQQDIARAQALAQLGQQSEQSGYRYSQQQVANARQNLSLAAAANGISEQQLVTMLQYGQAQAGQQAAQNVAQLYAGQESNVLGTMSNIGAQLSQAGFATNLNALAGTNIGVFGK